MASLLPLILLPIPTTSSAMASFIAQDLIPSNCDIAPRSISRRKFGPKDIGAITKHVRDNDTSVLGLSLRLSPKDGKVDLVALATRTHIFQVPLAQSSPSNCSDDLARLLASSRCHIAAFDMARSALHLHKQCGVRVRGVDLSTLISTSTAAPDSPAELASTRVHPNISRLRIHALWHGDEIENVCLRAWLSALCVFPSSSRVFFYD